MSEVIGMGSLEVSMLDNMRKIQRARRKAFNRRRYKRQYRRVQEARGGTKI